MVSIGDVSNGEGGVVPVNVIQLKGNARKQGAFQNIMYSFQTRFQKTQPWETILVPNPVKTARE